AVIDTQGEKPAQQEAPKQEAPKQEPPKQEAPKEEVKQKEEEVAKPASKSASPSADARYSVGQFIEEAKRGEEPQKREPQPPTPPAPVEGGRAESRRRMPKIRQVIARRLVEVQQTTAMLTTFNECDMSAVMELRAKHKEEF